MLTTLLSVLFLVVSPTAAPPASTAPSTVTANSAGSVAVDVEPLCI